MAQSASATAAYSSVVEKTSESRLIELTAFAVELRRFHDHPAFTSRRSRDGFCDDVTRVLARAPRAEDVGRSVKCQSTLESAHAFYKKQHESLLDIFTCFNRAKDHFWSAFDDVDGGGGGSCGRHLVEAHGSVAIFVALLLKRVHRSLNEIVEREYERAESVVREVERRRTTARRPIEERYEAEMKEAEKRFARRWTRVDRDDDGDSAAFRVAFARENLERSCLSLDAFAGRFATRRTNRNAYLESVDDRYPLSSECPSLPTDAGVDATDWSASDLRPVSRDLACLDDELSAWWRGNESRSAPFNKWLDELAQRTTTFAHIVQASLAFGSASLLI